MSDDEYLKTLRKCVARLATLDWSTIDDDLHEEYTRQVWWLVNHEVAGVEADALRAEIRRLVPWV